MRATNILIRIPYICVCVQDSFNVVDAFQLMGSNGFLFMFSVRQAHKHQPVPMPTPHTTPFTTNHNHFNIAKGVEHQPVSRNEHWTWRLHKFPFKDLMYIYKSIYTVLVWYNVWTNTHRVYYTHPFIGSKCSKKLSSYNAWNMALYVRICVCNSNYNKKYSALKSSILTI